VELVRIPSCIRLLPVLAGDHHLHQLAWN
jgi:hypothetical protein